MCSFINIDSNELQRGYLVNYGEKYNISITIIGEILWIGLVKK